MAMVSCRKAFTAKLLQNAKKNADILQSRPIPAAV